MQCPQLDNLLWKCRQEILYPITLQFPSLKKEFISKKRAAWASNRQLLENLKWAADFCKERQTVLQNTVFMPGLAKVSQQNGQLAFRVTLQLTKQISCRLGVFLAPLLRAPADGIPCNPHRVCRAQRSNSSCFLQGRLRATAHFHSCPMQSIQTSQTSQLSAAVKDKQTSDKDQHGSDTIQNADNGR